jgi:ATP-binding cassette subfamily B (MDR/TAP) protein 7
VLKEGNVAEQGTHEQLINKAGLYTELWSAQETMFSTPDVDVEEKEGGKGDVKI